MGIKQLVTGVVSLLFPSVISRTLLRIIGHKIGAKCKIGFSFLGCSELEMGDNAKIGSLNWFQLNALRLESGCNVGTANFAAGPFSIDMLTDAAIGNFNRMTRAPLGVTSGVSILRLGVLTKITSSHKLDLTRSISFGDYSIMAGSDSQIWTHGYFHHSEGPGRFRVDGEINVGNNVYIGSRAVINAGVKIGNAISVGSNTTVSKSITEPGLYVSQPVRYIPVSVDAIKSKLDKSPDTNLIEEVYIKRV